jgi:hypothetical protein
MRQDGRVCPRQGQRAGCGVQQLDPNHVLTPAPCDLGGDILAELGAYEWRVGVKPSHRPGSWRPGPSDGVSVE